MEVHHHPEVEKKGIKEYLLEGLMIFVAVTMGFFAESLREHISERQHMKEYATSLYVDLKADTASLNKYLSRINFGVNHVDTLLQLLSANDPKDIPSGKLYWYGLFGGMMLNFSPNDATLLEIKSTGSLRFFSKLSIRNAIAQYDQELQTFKANQTYDQSILVEVRKARAEIFYFKYNEDANTVYQHIFKHYDKTKVDSFFRLNPPLLTSDKVLFNHYVELIRSRFLKLGIEKMANQIRTDAINLMAVLKKEYNIDEE